MSATASGPGAAAGPAAPPATSLLAAARPFLWVNTAFPFLAAGWATAGGITPAVAVGFLYFLLPYNLLMYGVNDLHDYASDLANPRKASVEGGLVPPARGPRLLAAIALTNAPLLAALWLLGGPAAGIAALVAALAAWIYSAPPLRTKERPGLDALTSALHFVLPAVTGCLAGGLALAALPWPLLAAFLAWGIASQSLGAIQDIAYDRAAGIASIATALGARRTAWVSLAGYGIAIAIVVGMGVPGIVGALVLASFLLLPLGVLADPTEAGARRAWRGFLGLCLLAGLVLCHLLLRLWGVTDWTTTGLLVTLAGTALALAAAGTLAERAAVRAAPTAGGAAAGAAGDVAVVVPARDAAATIGTTLAAARAAVPPGTPLGDVVDHAADPTGAAAAAALGPTGRVLVAGPPPADRTGWAHALAAGVAATGAPWILVVDAGTRLAPDGVARLRAAAAASGAGCVSADPAPDPLPPVGAGGSALASLARPFLPPLRIVRADGRRAVRPVTALRLLRVARTAWEAAGGVAALDGAAEPAAALGTAIGASGGRTHRVRGAGIAAATAGMRPGREQERARAILSGPGGETPAMTIALLTCVALAWVLPLLLVPAGILAGDGILVRDGLVLASAAAGIRLLVAGTAGAGPGELVRLPAVAVTALGAGAGALIAATRGRPRTWGGRPLPDPGPGRQTGVPIIPVPAAGVQPGPLGGDR
ncbi:MAG: prenyltransferase [Chloroflexota bacterium]